MRALRWQLARYASRHAAHIQEAYSVHRVLTGWCLASGWRGRTRSCFQTPHAACRHSARQHCCKPRACASGADTASAGRCICSWRRHPCCSSARCICPRGPARVASSSLPYEMDARTLARACVLRLQPGSHACKHPARRHQFQRCGSHVCAACKHLNENSGPQALVILVVTAF